MQIKQLDRSWQREVENILNAFDVDPEQGLSSGEVRNQCKRHGRNRLLGKEYKSTWAIFLEQEEISGDEVIDLLGIETDSNQISKSEKL